MLVMGPAQRTTLTSVITKHVVIPTLTLMIVGIAAEIEVMSIDLKGSHVEVSTVSSVFPLTHASANQKLVMENVEKIIISALPVSHAYTIQKLVMESVK